MRLQSFFTLMAAAISAAQQSPHVSTVFQLEDVGTWFENLAVRPSGSVLATRMDAPEIWHIDPSTNTGSALLTVPSALSTTGITELTADVFVFAAANFSFADPVGLAPGSMAVWKVDLSGEEWGPDDSPEPELVAGFPDATFLNGMATWDETRVLVGDTIDSVVYLLDVETGEFEVALDGPEVSGVNGLRVHEGEVYAVSTTEQLLYRIPVDEQARISGEAEALAEGLGLDDFDVGADGAIYAASPANSVVVKIHEGVVTTVAGGADSRDVVSPTSVRIGRGEGNENVLYVSTTGNGAFAPPGVVGEPASIVAINLVEEGEEVGADEGVETE